MQDSNPSYDSEQSAAFTVSPMTSEASMTGDLIISTTSPPPYTPSDTMAANTESNDEKYPPDFKKPVPDGAEQQTTTSGQLNTRSNAGRASWMDLPEVVPESFPETVPSSLPETSHSTLPEAAAAASASRTNLSTLPEVATGSTSRVNVSTLPEAVMPNLNKMEMVSISERALNTVTPLHLLGDEPDQIDCPFCHKQSMTEVKKKPSNRTHIQAVLLLFTTVCGAAAPYIGSWSFDIEHFCNLCQRKVAYRSRGKEIYVCKQPDSVKQVSKYGTGAGP